MTSQELKRLIDEIISLRHEISHVKGQLAAGQVSYAQTVTTASYSHQHMPSALKSGNLAAAINFTTRPTYNGADVIVDGDPVGLQADDDSTRLGVDADTAVTTGTKVLHVSLVDQSGNAMEAQDLASRAGFQKITDGTNFLPTMDAVARAGFIQITDATNGPVAVKAGNDTSNLNTVWSQYISAVLKMHGGSQANLLVEGRPATSTTVPNLDGINLLGTHSLFSFRKDANTTIGATGTDGTYNPLHVQITDGEELQTTGKYAVTMEIESIAASQDFIMIDKSDTTNFPHTTGTGTVHITVLDMEIDPDSSFVGDIELGFLENVDGTNGDFHVMKEWHMDKRADIIEDFVNVIMDPFKCSSTYHLTNEISLNDIAFQTDVALSSPYDDAAAYSTMSGDGDIALRVTMSAGTADLSLVIKYYVA